MSGHRIAVRSHAEAQGIAAVRVKTSRKPEGTGAELRALRTSSTGADVEFLGRWIGPPQPQACPLPPIQEFRDYREYLLAFYSWKRSVNHRFSYRMLASKWMLDVSFVYRVLHGKNHLALSAVDRVVRAIGLGPEDARDFALLVRWGRSASENERDDIRNTAGKRAEAVLLD